MNRLNSEQTEQQFGVDDYETYNDDLTENSDNTVQNDALLPVDLLKVSFSTLCAATVAADNLNEMGPNLL